VFGCAHVNGKAQQEDKDECKPVIQFRVHGNPWIKGPKLMSNIGYAITIPIKMQDLRTGIEFICEIAF
jgi:hypothetical protein